MRALCVPLLTAFGRRLAAEPTPRRIDAPERADLACRLDREADTALAEHDDDADGQHRLSGGAT